MRRIVRLLRLVLAVVSYTAWTQVRARLQPAHRRYAYRARRQQRGVRIILRILNVRVTMLGPSAEELQHQADATGLVPAGQPAVVASNHIGVLDPFVLASKLPMALAAKSEIRGWPVAGWVTRTMGVIFVERGRAPQVRRFLASARERLSAGVHLGVFPEGTTNRTHELLPFKTGAFETVARRPDAWVLPVYVTPVEVNGQPAAEGSLRESVVWDDPSQNFAAHVWGLLGLQSIHYRLVVGRPIAAAGRDRKQLAQLAHAQVRGLEASGVSTRA